MKKLVSACLIGMTSLAMASTTIENVALKKAIEAMYPHAQIRSIVKTSYADLYEVYLNGQIIYTDERFSFALTDGRLVDMRSRRDVTADRLSELTKIDFSKLPLELAIKVVKGNGSRVLVVFSDPDCPYCRKLERDELSALNNVTIYTFLYPIKSLHPDAERKSRAIWCAKDKVAAWNSLMLKGQEPVSGKDCDDPLQKLAALGNKLGINSTPTLIFEHGRRVSGVYPAKVIEKMLGKGFDTVSGR